MKKDKKQIKESIIGKIIYGFLMFSPLLAILVSSLYVIINPNAKDSYYGETINEKQYHNMSVNQMLDYNHYIFNIPLITSTQTDSGATEIYCYTIIVNNDDSLKYENSNLRFYVYTGVLRGEIRYNNQVQYQFNTANTSIVIDIDFGQVVSNNQSTSDLINNYLYYITYNKYSYLDNAFYYGLDSVENSSYFGWSKNTAIYSVLNTTCNGLGITTTFVPMILSYWLIISVIYLIYDLVLVFIHIAHKKVHELEEF